MSLISFIIVLPLKVLFAILDCYCYFQILALLDLMIVYLYLRKCLISCSKQLLQSFISTLLFILTTFDSIFISGSIFFFVPINCGTVFFPTIRSFFCASFCKASFQLCCLFDSVYFQYKLLSNSMHMLV